MKKILLVLPALCAAGLSPARAQGDWETFQPPLPVSFSVQMPAPPQKLGNQTEWRAQDAEGRVYTVAFGYYTEPKITDPNAFMKMMVARLSANTGSKTAYTWFFKYQYAPACEFKLVDVGNHQVGVGRYFLLNQWFYFLDITAPDQDFDADGAKQFFDSFRMINPALKGFQPGP